MEHEPDLLIRRPRLAAATASIALMILLALIARYHHMSGPDEWDLWLDRRVERIAGAWFSESRPIVTILGPLGTGLVCVVLATICTGLSEFRRAVFAVFAPLMSGVAVVVLQPVVGRTLDGGDALPSGHSAAATCGALVAAVLVPRLLGRRPRALACSAVVMVVGLAMGFALVTNALHFSSDVIAGACTGIAATLFTALTVDRMAAVKSSFSAA